MPTRDFHISDILTITTGRLLSTRHMEGVYEILNFMTGDNLFTHQLPRAAESCKPALLAQYPHLVDLVEPDAIINADTLPGWVAKQVAKFGETLPVTPLAAWQPKGAIQELSEMMPGKDIAVVVPEQAP